MLIIFNEYSIKGRSFQSTESLERKTKPLTYPNANAIYTMFAVAKAQLSQIAAMISTGKVSSRLNIVEGNLKSILPFMDCVREIDIGRNELLLAE